MIKITAKGLKEFQDFVRKVPEGVKIEAMREIAKYLVGDTRHGLRYEPPWKFVSRARAYPGLPKGPTKFSSKSSSVSLSPKGYASWKQYHKVGYLTNWFKNIPQERTHDISKGWDFNNTGDWRRVKIENPVPGVEWVMGEQQANQPRLVGWRKWPQVLKDNLKGALREGQRAVDRWIKTHSR